MRRIISIVSVLCLCFSLVTPAFASSSASRGTWIDVSDITDTDGVRSSGSRTSYGRSSGSRSSSGNRSRGSGFSGAAEASGAGALRPLEDVSSGGSNDNPESSGQFVPHLNDDNYSKVYNLQTDRVMEYPTSTGTDWLFSSRTNKFGILPSSMIGLPYIGLTAYYNAGLENYLPIPGQLYSNSNAGNEVSDYIVSNGMLQTTFSNPSSIPDYFVAYYKFSVSDPVPSFRIWSRFNVGMSSSSNTTTNPPFSMNNNAYTGSGIFLFREPTFTEDDFVQGNSLASSGFTYQGSSNPRAVDGWLSPYVRWYAAPLSYSLTQPGDYYIAVRIKKLSTNWSSNLAVNVHLSVIALNALEGEWDWTTPPTDGPDFDGYSSPMNVNFGSQIGYSIIDSNNKIFNGPLSYTDNSGAYIYNPYTSTYSPYTNYNVSGNSYSYSLDNGDTITYDYSETSLNVSLITDNSAIDNSTITYNYWISDSMNSYLSNTENVTSDSHAVGKGLFGLISGLLGDFFKSISDKFTAGLDALEEFLLHSMVLSELLFAAPGAALDLFASIFSVFPEEIMSVVTLSFSIVFAIAILKRFMK